MERYKFNHAAAKELLDLFPVIREDNSSFGTNNITGDNYREMLLMTPTSSMGPTIDHNSLNEENLAKFEEGLKSIIDNPIITNEEEPKEEKNDITCFKEETNKKLNELFNDPDLLFYGHGGNAEAIMNDKFRCRYANILSHFVPLSGNNESLSQMKNWPHNERKKIAIMALNKHEFNPIYEERERTNGYDTDVYSIDNEYFAGYYDADKDEFIPNPNFKKTHEYNPKCTLYQNDLVQNSFTRLDEGEEIRDFYKNIQIIPNIMKFSSEQATLDKIGYFKVSKAIFDRLKKSKELLQKIPKDYQNEEVNNVPFDFNVDWGFPTPDDSPFAPYAGGEESSKINRSKK